VNRAHDRLGAILHHRQARIQSDAAILLSGGHLAEFFDVGPGDKGSPAADEHDPLDRFVLLGRLDRRQDSLRHAGAHRIDRRIVDRNNRDVPILREVH